MQPDLFTSARAGRTDAAEILTDLEVDYSPEAVAVQCLLALFDRLIVPDSIVDVLDPSAGSGVWPRAARVVLGRGRFPQTRPLRIHGVEIRPSEEANLASACDTYAIGSALGPAVRAGAPYDLIITNPPFTAFADGGWPENFAERGLLREDGIVALYGLSQWGQSEAAAEMLRRWPPSKQLRLGGRPQHRGDGKGDAREYCLWVWHEEMRHSAHRSRRPTWSTEQLPVLPADLRRWRPDAVPGTRPIDPSLVEMIRGRYL